MSQQVRPAAPIAGFAGWLDEELADYPEQRLRQLLRKEADGDKLVANEVMAKRRLVVECLARNPKHCPNCDATISPGTMWCNSCRLDFQEGDILEAEAVDQRVGTVRCPMCSSASSEFRVARPRVLASEESKLGRDMLVGAIGGALGGPFGVAVAASVLKGIDDSATHPGQSDPLCLEYVNHFHCRFCKHDWVDVAKARTADEQAKSLATGDKKQCPKCGSNRVRAADFNETNEYCQRHGKFFFLWRPRKCESCGHVYQIRKR
jgi:hypothetical protein